MVVQIRGLGWRARFVLCSTHAIIASCHTVILRRGNEGTHFCLLLIGSPNEAELLALTAEWVTSVRCLPHIGGPSTHRTPHSIRVIMW